MNIPACRVYLGDYHVASLVGYGNEDFVFVPAMILGFAFTIISFIDKLTPVLQFVSILLGVISLAAGLYLIKKRIEYRKLSIIQKRMELTQAIDTMAVDVIRDEVVREAVRRLSVEDSSDVIEELKQNTDYSVK